MNKFDNKIKESVEAFVPPMPDSCKSMIESTVSELKAAAASEQAKPSRKLRRSLAAAAAAIAVLLLSAAAVFGARPALAADIPGINSAVYAASPTKNASPEDTDKLKALICDTFGALASGEREAAARCFKAGCLDSRGNYLAAAYLGYALTFGDSFPDNMDALAVGISDIKAEQKAFRYTADVTLAFISRDGTRLIPEECSVIIRENMEGMYVESIEMLSADYDAFARTYEETFGPVPTDGASFGIIPFDTDWLVYKAVFAESEGARQREDRLTHMLSVLDKANATREEKELRAAKIQAELDTAAAEITPEVVTAEDVAAELMYRYWLAARTGEVCDFTDIAEHNEQTDLFLWDALLQAEKISLGVLKPLKTVEKESSKLLEVINETDELIKARFYVYTSISDGVSSGVGEEIILTLRKDGETGFTVIGFDRDVGDGLYTYSLKPLAARYMAEGHTWQEAGRLAYAELHAQLEEDAAALAQYQD